MIDSIPGSDSLSHPQAVNDELSDAYRDIRRLPLFEGVADKDLWSLVYKQRLLRFELDRDQFIPQTGEDSGPRIVLVLRGQIGVSVFEGKALAGRRLEQNKFADMNPEERKEQSLLKPPPLARVALKNLATFMAGDLFNAGAISRGAGENVAFFSLAPTQLASFGHADIADLAVRYPAVQERLRRAMEIARERLGHVTGVKQEILDFFIRHGISVSGDLVRVRQLDSCIDCKLCEIACEQRYGAKRLTLGGYQLGMLDFVFTCRTCTDQRCIDPCEYDSIRFDAEIQEVVINEASCVGCTLCAQSCPYDAIEMVDVDDPEEPTFRVGFKERLDRDNFLMFGPGKPRVARPRRIANKCDHCMNYGDQACVSACPTGSLIEISAYDLFQERAPELAAIAQGGFNEQTRLNHSRVLPERPFTKGVGVRNAGLAKTRRGRLWPVLMWGVALAAWLLALAEILLRLYQPTSSLQFGLLRSEGLEPVIAAGKVGFRSGSDLAIYCGWLGAGLMVLAVLYTPLRRIRGFRRIASNTMWFDFHMMAGTMGPAFVLLHSGLNYKTYAAFAFWTMALVVVSGIVGRYLYTQVPDLLNGRELEELDHERALERIRASHPQAVAAARAILAPHQAVVERVAKSAGFLRAFAWIVAEDLRRPFRWMKRRSQFRGLGLPKDMRRELSMRTGRLQLMERRKVLAPRAQLILHSWKRVHVPFSIIMTIAVVHHVILEFPKTL